MSRPHESVPRLPLPHRSVANDHSDSQPNHASLGHSVWSGTDRRLPDCPIGCYGGVCDARYSQGNQRLQILFVEINFPLKIMSAE